MGFFFCMGGGVEDGFSVADTIYSVSIWIVHIAVGLPRD